MTSEKHIKLMRKATPTDQYAIEMEDIDVHKELNDIEKATPTPVIRWPSLHLLSDFALTLLEDDKELAVARHVQFGTALHMLAQNPSAFVCRSTGPLKRLISS
ncbi:hypothetical protein Patl1_24149 [Pistacia atlantica]|uniref:Uncharacterized protein n=1 Tax=Pistacia atlantica TaxID=434234 RepID=A0ACC0ZZV3_9ROSI|nr:hypothetical protein Patl1_24149 [Pistacia atlantica]